MVSEEVFNFHSEPYYFEPNIGSKLQNDNIEDTEVKNRLEKLDLLAL